MFLGHGGLVALTVDPGGDNLPRAQGPWRKIGAIEGPDEIAYAAVAAEGYMFMQRIGEPEGGPDHMPPQHPTLQ